MTYTVFDVTEANENYFNKIGSDWALLSSSKEGKCNGMTIGWGGTGILWRKKVFFCFVRPQRYTKEFCDNSDIITLSFFGEDKKEALKICGSKSGRDCDKLSLAGLTPVIGSMGEVDYEESAITLVGRKLYAQDLTEESFIDKALMVEMYPERDFHTMYVCEIIEARRK